MNAVDARLFETIFRFAHQSAFFDALAVVFAVYIPYLLVAGFALLLLQEKNVRRRIFLFCEAGVAVIISRGIVTELIRFFWNRPRPLEMLSIVSLVPHDSGGAFPSGHMAFFMALAVLVWYAYRAWGLWYIGGVAVVGIARIVAGLHFPFDIAGGIVIGAVAAIAVHRLLAPYNPHGSGSSGVKLEE